MNVFRIMEMSNEPHLVPRTFEASLDIVEETAIADSALLGTVKTAGALIRPEAAALSGDMVAMRESSAPSGLLSLLEHQAALTSDSADTLPQPQPFTPTMTAAGVPPQVAPLLQPDPLLAEQQLIATIGPRAALNLRDSDVAPLQTQAPHKDPTSPRTIGRVQRKSEQRRERREDPDQDQKQRREELLDELFERSREAERTERALDL